MTETRPDVLVTVRAAVQLELLTIRKMIEAAADSAERRGNIAAAAAHRADAAFIKSREAEIQ
jgi:hypothetical protein